MNHKIIYFILLFYFIQIAQCLNYKVGFSGGGTRSALLTHLTLKKINLEPVTGLSGVSGGAWGLTLFNNGFDTNDMKELGFDSFEMITDIIEDPNCCSILCRQANPDIYMTYFQQERTTCCVKNSKKAWWEWVGKESWSMFLCIKDAAIKSMNKYDFIPRYSQEMGDFGHWNKTGLLSKKDIRFLMRLTSSVDYPDLHPIMCSVGAKDYSIIRCAKDDLTFEQHVIVGVNGKTFDHREIMAIVGSAFTSHISLSLLKINPFLPQEIKPLYINNINYKFLNDAGITYNNPYEHAVVDKDGIHLLIDFSAQTDFGMGELLKIREYITRLHPKSQTKIHHKSYCSVNTECPPDLSPMHWLFTDDGVWIIHISLFDKPHWNRLTDLLPTYNTKYSGLKIKMIESHTNEFTNRIADISVLIYEMENKEESNIIRMTEILFRKTVTPFIPPKNENIDRIDTLMSFKKEL